MPRLLLSLFIIVNTPSFSQTDRDSVLIASASQTIAAHYWDVFKLHGSLISGTAYKEYQSVQDEHPYFMNDDWFSGEITYGGMTIQNVALQFDISAQKILIEHPVSAQKLELVKEKISNFNLGDFKFIKLKVSHDNGDFYQLLENGFVKLVVKRIKSLQQKSSSGRLFPVFQEQNKFYIVTREQIVPIGNRSSLKKALANLNAVSYKRVQQQKVSFANKEAGFRTMVSLFNSNLQ